MMAVLVWAGLVATFATRVLPSARWVFRSPGLGLCAWWSVLAVVICAPLAAAAALLGWSGNRAAVCAWWAWCVQVIGGRYGPVGRGLAMLLAVVLLAVGARAVWAGWRAGRALGECRRRYAPMLAGAEHRWDLGASVVDDPVPAAFAVPGRHRRVVLTTAALQVLPAEQVAAVLAHERAHAAGHHQLLADAARLLAAAFPAVVVFVSACQQIDRLVEMRADDVAARRHTRLDLARALVAMAQSGERPPPAGAVTVGVLAATGGDALERVRRLLEPPTGLPAAVRVGVGAGLVALAFTPAAMLVLARVFPLLSGCLPMG